MNEADLEMIKFARSLHSGEQGGGDDYWTDFADDNSLGELVVKHLRLVALGIKDFEYKMLASFGLMQSSLCSIAPVIQLFGSEGSGKSQLLLAISELTEQEVFVGGSTGASIKNHINKIRWADPSTLTHEKNCLLLCDNVNRSTFDTDETLTVFLNGYNRKTDRQFISNGKGENIEFRTFCPKLFTSVWNVESKELLRRTLIIRTNKSANPTGIVEIESVNWMPGRIAIKEFWRQSHTWTAFAECKHQFMKQKQPRHSKEYWILMRDLLATGVVTGVFESIESAIEEAAEWLDTATKKRVQVLDSVIIEAIEKYIGKKRLEWATVATVVDIHIPPKAIKNAIDEAVADGIIERPKLTATQESLTSLGFRPFRDNSGTFVYRFIP